MFSLTVWRPESEVKASLGPWSLKSPGENLLRAFLASDDRGWSLVFPGLQTITQLYAPGFILLPCVCVCVCSCCLPSVCPRAGSLLRRTPVRSHLGPTPVRYDLIQLITPAKTLLPNKIHNPRCQEGHEFGGTTSNPARSTSRTRAELAECVGPFPRGRRGQPCPVSLHRRPCVTCPSLPGPPGAFLEVT